MGSATSRPSPRSTNAVAESAIERALGHAQSKHALTWLGVDVNQGSCCLSEFDGKLRTATRSDATGGARPLHIAGSCRGFKRNQDRFVIVPDLMCVDVEHRASESAKNSPASSSVSPRRRRCRTLCTAVFDGHGTQGGAVAEEAALLLPGLVHYFAHKESRTTSHCHQQPHQQQQQLAEADSGRLMRATARALDAYQAHRESEFRNLVVAPIEQMMEDMNARGFNQQEPPPMQSVGGTTATVLMMTLDLDTGTACSATVSWVGDSRAVMATLDLTRVEQVDGESSGDTPVSSDRPSQLGLRTARLVADHSPDRPSEAARLAGIAQAAVSDGYVGVDGASQMLQVTRSLGDCASHRFGVVVSEPEHHHITFGARRLSAPEQSLPRAATAENQADVVPITQGAEYEEGYSLAHDDGDKDFAIARQPPQPKVGWGKAAAKLAATVEKENTSNTPAASSVTASAATSCSAPAFIIVASDGVWHVFSDAEAVAFVEAALVATGYSDLVLAAHKPETNVQPVSYGKKVEHVAESEGGEACLRALEDVALQLVTEANRRAEEAGEGVDDVTAVVLTFDSYARAMARCR